MFERARTILVIPLFAGLWLAAPGCGSRDRSPVIAVVNGQDLHRAQFEQFLRLKLGELSSGETSEALRSRMLDEYIRRRLVLAEAKKAGLSVTDAEIEQAANDNPPIRSTAASADSRDELVNHLLVEKYYSQVLLKDVHVTPEEIEKYISENQARIVEKPAFEVREIRVHTADEAERLREQVTTGKVDFAIVARQHSEAPSAEAGGLVRYEQGQLPSVLGKAVEPLNPGDVSPVIQSSFGFHIFKMERRIQPHPGDERRARLDERRAELAEELIARRNQQVVDEALDRLVSRATIRINDALLGFTYSGELRHN
jgi:parvulin-like peptidyl-prolyl isomerase